MPIVPSTRIGEFTPSSETRKAREIRLPTQMNSCFVNEQKNEQYTNRVCCCGELVG